MIRMELLVRPCLPIIFCAACVLPVLLHLGIKGIRLGASLPALLMPNVLDTLVENSAIRPIATTDNDLTAILR